MIRVTKARRGFKAVVKLTIPPASMALAEAKTASLRRAVVPIIGAKPRATVIEQPVPFGLGSGVLIQAGGRSLLVTAGHVLTENEHVPLFTFGPDRTTRPLDRSFHFSEDADLAAKVLSPAEAESFAHHLFLDRNAIGSVANDGEKIYAAVVGFPGAQGKRKDWVTIDTQMSALFDMATEAGGKVRVTYDKKGGMERDGVHITPPSPDGMSGGAIFGMPIKGFTIDPAAEAKLVGIMTGWPGRAAYLEGEGAQHLLRLIDQLA